MAKKLTKTIINNNIYAEKKLKKYRVCEQCCSVVWFLKQYCLLGKLQKM